MKQNLVFSTIILITSLTLLISCSTSGSAGHKGPDTKNQVSSNEHLTLEDYLRRLNGVQVQGSGNNLTVTIRSNMSVSNSTEQPLFIVNGQKIGNSYSEVASIVDQETITSVEAIPPSRASMYGIEGGAGVILIRTE